MLDARCCTLDAGCRAERSLGMEVFGCVVGAAFSRDWPGRDASLWNHDRASGTGYRGVKTPFKNSSACRKGIAMIQEFSQEGNPRRHDRPRDRAAVARPAAGRRPGRGRVALCGPPRRHPAILRCRAGRPRLPYRARGVSRGDLRSQRRPGATADHQRRLPGDRPDLHPVLAARRHHPGRGTDLLSGAQDFRRPRAEPRRAAHGRGGAGGRGRRGCACAHAACVSLHHSDLPQPDQRLSVRRPGARRLPG